MNGCFLFLYTSLHEHETPKLKLQIKTVFSPLFQNDPSSVGWLKVSLLDMQFSSDDGVTILAAAVNPNVSKEVVYALGGEITVLYCVFY